MEIVRGNIVKVPEVDGRLYRCAPDESPVAVAPFDICNGPALTSLPALHLEVVLLMEKVWSLSEHCWRELTRL